MKNNYPMEGGFRVVTLSNNQLTIKINEFGAEVSSVTDQKSGYEFMWQADDKYWGRHAPVLFPIVGRLKNDQYEYEGQTYEMTQHGFARDSMFEVKEITEETATFSLTDSQETLKKYPFKFELVIKYTLEEKTLTVTYEVKNRSTRKVMYYGIGGHPAFNVSQTADEDGNTEFDKISFHFEPNNEQLFIPLSTEGLLKLKEAEKQTVDEIQLTHDTFKEDALIYKVEPNSEMVLTDETEGVEIRLNPLEMEHVGVWSPYPARGGFVCLEPWAGVADDEETTGQFNKKYGIHKLNPEQIMTHEYTIQFTKKAD